VKELYGDTGYWIAQILSNDALHKVAQRLTDALTPDTRIVTSDLVLVEFLNHVSAIGTQARFEAISICNDLYTDPDIVVVPAASSRQLREAMKMYEKFYDKYWSLTDCLSFIIMRERKIQDALTFDHHFEQAGFRALLREE
jgi:hypothetical protein